MKQKSKNFLKLGILLLGIPLLFFTCLKDDSVSGTESFTKPTFNIRIEPYEHLKSQNQKLAKTVDKLMQNKSLQRSSTSQEYGFTINDNNVQVMERELYTTYTFLVFRDSTETNRLENYVFKQNNDGTYEQYLLKYHYSLNEQEERIYNTTDLDIESINDEGLLLSRPGGDNCVPEFVEVLDGITCTNNTVCTGDGHYAGQQCDCENTPATCYRAGSSVCELNYVYVYHGCSGGTGGDDGNGDGTDPSGGGGSGGVGTSNDDDETPDDNNEIIAVPFEDLTEKQVQKECRKIRNFLNAPENVVFKQKLLDYANADNYNQNLDVEFEKSITAHENETQIQERQGHADSASVDISYTLSHSNKTKAWAHLHPNDSLGTYSVFSFDDLVGISKILANDKLDTGTFVAFLITKKGDNLTYYAMTINNKSKFQDFFYSYQDFNFLQATQLEKDKRIAADKKSNQLRTKYYEHKTSPLISYYNVNSQQMLTQFLKFMQEADLGATLFASDENFSDFIRVSYDNNLVTGGIKEQTCND